MSKSNSRRELELIYRYPLPINVIIPDFNSCAPQSSNKKSNHKNSLNDNCLIQIIKQWKNYIYWIIRNYCLFIRETSYSRKGNQKNQKAIEVKVTSENIFKVDVNVLDSENCGALRLWRCGFFGKGILSRSEPTWYQRTERRLYLVEEKLEELTSEEITILRRDERKKFKKIREDFEKKQLELELNISKILEEKEKHNDKKNLEILEKLSNELRILKETSLKNLDFKKFISENRMKLYLKEDSERDENKELLASFVEKNVDGEIERQKLIQLEYLQLMPIEVFFLKFALDDNVIRVSNEDDESDYSTLQLFKRFTANIEGPEKYNIQPDNYFLLHYVVYHHYRSQGWCVRSGVKFGIDYLLYERGPPLSHAQYCLHIINNNKDKNMNDTYDDEIDFVEYSSINRVIGSVKKNLIFVYVGIIGIDKTGRFTSLINQLDNNNLTHGEAKLILREILSLYTISEMLYRRWIPSRNRD